LFPLIRKENPVTKETRNNHHTFHNANISLQFKGKGKIVLAQKRGIDNYNRNKIVIAPKNCYMVEEERGILDFKVVESEDFSTVIFSLPYGSMIGDRKFLLLFEGTFEVRNMSVKIRFFFF